MTIHYKTEDEIRALVEAFEACSFHPSEFRHYQHLTVALWYVWHLPFGEAEERVKTGIRKLAETYGKTGYHETITLFWLRMVSIFASSVDRKSPLAATANRMIEKYTNKDLIFDYYSSELIDSAKAKAEWIEPDLQRIQF